MEVMTAKEVNVTMIEVMAKVLAKEVSATATAGVLDVVETLEEEVETPNIPSRVKAVIEMAMKMLQVAITRVRPRSSQISKPTTTTTNHPPQQTPHQAQPTKAAPHLPPWQE